MIYRSYSVFILKVTITFVFYQN